MMSRVLLVVAVCALLAAVSSAVSSESPLHRQHHGHVHQHHVTAHKFSRTHHTPTHASGALAVKKSLDTLARDVSRLLEEEVTLIDNLRELAGENFPLREDNEHHVCDLVGYWLMEDAEREEQQPRLFSSFDDTQEDNIDVNLDDLELNKAYQIGFKVEWTEDQINNAANERPVGAERNKFLDTFSKRNDDYVVIQPRQLDPGYYEIHNFVVVRTNAGYFLLQGALNHFSLLQWITEDQTFEDGVNVEGVPSTITSSGAATAHNAFGRGAALSLVNLKAGMATILNAVTTEAMRKQATLNTFGFDDEYNNFVTYKPGHNYAFFRLGTATVHADSR